MNTPTITQSDRRYRLARLALIFAFILGVVAIMGLTHEPERVPVPKCEEDELLEAINYPYTNTDNLRCIHIDAIMEETGP